MNSLFSFPFLLVTVLDSFFVIIDDFMHCSIVFV